MKIQKKKIGVSVEGGRVGRGVRVGVNEELKILRKLTKNIFLWGVGFGGGGSCWGVRMDVNEELRFF